jgi:OFA family oxalate/formate antiporter-like MFS transporter
MTDTISRPRLTLLAGCVVTGTLGSLHAFSVFLVPLESNFEASRSSISLVYSLALVTLTVMVLVGHRLYGLVSPATLAALACIGAALGLVLAGAYDSLLGLYVGYGVLFGAANGVGYGFVLQLVAQAVPTAPGMAMGLVTAVYAAGSIAFAKFYAMLLVNYSPAETMFAMAAVMLLTSVIVWLLLTASGARYRAASNDAQTGVAGQSTLVFRMWLGYGTGAAAGLMAIGHATAIVMDRGGTPAMMVAGVMTIGAGNALGGVLAGYLVDKIPPRVTLAVLPGLSCVALVCLTLVVDAAVAVGVLASIGFCYGAIIAVYPAAVAAVFGLEHAPRVYGRVFTAWGLAGLLAPWLAGVIYDQTLTYSVAILVAATLGLVSAALGMSLPQIRGGKTPI